MLLKRFIIDVKHNPGKNEDLPNADAILPLERDKLERPEFWICLNVVDLRR
jgi:hypothetical protein